MSFVNSLMEIFGYGLKNFRFCVNICKQLTWYRSSKHYQQNSLYHHSRPNLESSRTNNPQPAGWFQTAKIINTLRIIMEQSAEFNIPLYLIFVHFKQTFDSLDRSVMWRILASYGKTAKREMSCCTSWKAETMVYCRIWRQTRLCAVSLSVSAGIFGSCGR